MNEEFEFDENKIDNILSSTHNFIHYLIELMAKVKNKSTDNFIRYTSIIQLIGSIEISASTAKLFRSIFLLGFELNHPHFKTKECLESQFEKPDLTQVPFMKNKNEKPKKNDSQKFSDEKFNDLLHKLKAIIEMNEVDPIDDETMKH